MAYVRVNMESKLVIILVLIDLSNTFNTIDHDMMLSTPHRLKFFTSLNWFLLIFVVNRLFVLVSLLLRGSIFLMATHKVALCIRCYFQFILTFCLIYFTVRTICITMTCSSINTRIKSTSRV